MKIRIKKLSLSYFKGVRQASYDFGENIITIKGCNGSGKSTIVDAISWVLFGVDKNGDTKFGIKPRDKDGNTTEDVTSSVELTISVDENNIVLERALRGIPKTDGGVRNEYTYKVDGEVQTAGDFAKYVDDICPQSVWKICSTPLTFALQDWSEQRRMLTSMFGEPDVNMVSGGEKRFDFVIEELKKNSIEKIIKHLNYQHKEVLSQLNEIPTRIEELSKVLPEQDNWEGINNLLKEELSKRDELIKNLHYAEAGQEATVEAVQRRKKLDFAYRRKAEMETGAALHVNRLIIEHNNSTQSLQREIEKTNEIIGALKTKKSLCEETAKRYEQRRRELESEKLDGAARWSNILQQKWEWNEEDSYCPTCGQVLPIDRVEELKKRSQEDFLHRLAEDKKALLAKASQVKEDLVACEKELAELKDDEKSTIQKIDEAKKSYDDYIAKLTQLKEERVLSEEDILASNPSYKMVVEQIISLEEETDSLIASTLIQETKEQISAADKCIAELRKRLSVKMQYDNISKQIERINQQRKVLQEQLDTIDENIANTTAYQRRAYEVLEDIVNKNFSLVKWSMFRRQVDGTDKPWCECSVNGVPFSDLNSAMRINAGIDIINTLKRFCDVDVPCIIDNAETILEPLYDGGQQIRLRVTDDEVIRIDNEH